MNDLLTFSCDIDAHDDGDEEKCDRESGVESVEGWGCDLDGMKRRERKRCWSDASLEMKSSRTGRGGGNDACSPIEKMSASFRARGQSRQQQ